MPEPKPINATRCILDGFAVGLLTCRASEVVKTLERGSKFDTEAARASALRDISVAADLLKTIPTKCLPSGEPRIKLWNIAAGKLNEARDNLYAEKHPYDVSVASPLNDAITSIRKVQQGMPESFEEAEARKKFESEPIREPPSGAITSPYTPGEVLTE